MKAQILESISRLCAERGMSISALERLLGFGKGTIARWKKAEPGIGKLAAVARAFGVSVDSLIAGDQASDFRGKITVFRDGEAVCGAVFNDLWKMVSLVRIFGRGKLISIEIMSDGMETGQQLNSSADSGPQE